VGGRCGQHGAERASGATAFPTASISASFSRGASGVELLLFDREDDARPTRVIPIDPAANRTYHYWHVFLSGVDRARRTVIAVHGGWGPRERDAF